MGEWVSVEDQKLNVGEAVVYIPLMKEGYKNIVSVGEEGDLYDVDGAYIGYHASQVTHWMVVPENPVDGELV